MQRQMNPPVFAAALALASPASARHIGATALPQKGMLALDTPQAFMTAEFSCRLGRSP